MKREKFFNNSLHPDFKGVEYQQKHEKNYRFFRTRGI